MAGRRSARMRHAKLAAGWSHVLTRGDCRRRLGAARSARGDRQLSAARAPALHEHGGGAGDAGAGVGVHEAPGVGHAAHNSPVPRHSMTQHHEKPVSWLLTVPWGLQILRVSDYPLLWDAAAMMGGHIRLDYPCALAAGGARVQLPQPPSSVGTGTDGDSGGGGGGGGDATDRQPPPGAEGGSRWQELGKAGAHVLEGYWRGTYGGWQLPGACCMARAATNSPPPPILAAPPFPFRSQRSAAVCGDLCRRPRN
jgi:hypothetical protein